MKSLGFSGIFFLAFIFFYEAGQFALAYASGVACLLLTGVAIYFGKKEPVGMMDDEKKIPERLDMIPPQSPERSAMIIPLASERSAEIPPQSPARRRRRAA